MLVKVEYGGVQKYMKVPQSDDNFDFMTFLQEVSDKFGLQAKLGAEGVLTLTDTSGSEVDADIFDELIKSGVQNFKVVHHQYPVTEFEINLVGDESQSSVLTDPPVSPASLPVPPTSPGNSSSSDSTVILPSTKTRKRGLRELDRHEARREHFYDPEANSDYLAWRLKTVQRNTCDGRCQHSKPNFEGSPTTLRECLVIGGQLFGEDCKEALSVMRHSTDKAVVKEKMRATYEYRQKLVHDQDATSSILDVFPRFLDTPALMDQDLSMMFGNEVSERFVARCPSYFKPKVVEECRSLPANLYVTELVEAFDPEAENGYGWDSDTSALLLHLLPPTSRGHKKAAKISSAQAAKRLVRFVKARASLTTFLEKVDARQPFLLCIGEQKKKIQRFFIVVDQKAIPCSAEMWVAAFDGLFKAHYVFSLS
ncbi:uncharacterized protein KZ484_007049 [Pholidichthys leucotaenia]